ncbi:MAG: hypothetical protein NC452_08460 [Eubacterium sp.]|nr:hypothetical protein [Eubacterium sp.]
MKNKMTMFELNEKYSGCPVRVSEYKINGTKYMVHSHFVGNKDIDKVISKIAFNKAIYETLNKKSA